MPLTVAVLHVEALRRILNSRDKQHLGYCWRELLLTSLIIRPRYLAKTYVVEY
jgi:hypothetical protein